MRRSLAFALIALTIAACDRPPTADNLRDWTPADHDRNDEKEKSGAQGGARQRGAQQPRGTGNTGNADDGTVLIDATWKAQCLRCHGPIGHGDGPEGPMVKATDLTNGDWQDKVQDGDIAATIKTGKNKMPKFDLPDSVVQGLVARIRASRGR
jgi:Cytochrome C oxidase, cbb3-type, subunit III